MGGTKVEQWEGNGGKGRDEGGLKRQIKLKPPHKLIKSQKITATSVGTKLALSEEDETLQVLGSCPIIESQIFWSSS